MHCKFITQLIKFMHCLGEFWMKNILIVSATSGNNYILAQEIESLFKTKQANCTKKASCREWVGTSWRGTGCGWL